MFSGQGLWFYELILLQDSCHYIIIIKRIVVQPCSHVQLSATPWTAAHQASLSISNSWNLLKLMSIESVITSNHLILWCPLLLLPSIFPSIMDFSNESAVHIRWPKYWSFSFSTSPSNEYSRLISLKIDWFDLLALQGDSKRLDGGGFKSRCYHGVMLESLQ